MATRVRRIAFALAGVVLIVSTVWLIVLGDREDDHERQACAARGGTMVHTGTRMVPAGKAVFVPVPKYTCKGATR